MKVVRLSALSTGRLYLQELFLVLISVEAESTLGHSAAGRIMPMKNSNDTIGNPTRALPTCSVVPQPTAPPRAPIIGTLKNGTLKNGTLKNGTFKNGTLKNGTLKNSNLKKWYF